MDAQVSFPSDWVCQNALGKFFLFPAPYFPRRKIADNGGISRMINQLQTNGNTKYENLRCKLLRRQSLSLSVKNICMMES